MENDNDDLTIFQGRESELSRIVTILTQMKRNNLFLIGEPGVGCTSLLHQLEKSCHFATFRIFDIEKALLNPSNLLKAVERKPQPESGEKLIIALDGLDTLLTANDEHKDPVINWVKQVIIEKSCQLVLICGRESYQQFFMQDKRLIGRCQTFELKAPSFMAAVVMVRAQLEKTCCHYTVTISDDVIPAVVALAHRYIHDAVLPGSALNLLDASVANLKQKNMRSDLQLKDIIEVVSLWTGINEKDLLMSDEEKLRSCAAKLGQNIYGQDQALMVISRALQAGFLKLHSTKPMAMMLFAGPKGVGKMLTAEALAKLFYGSEHYLLRFNMENYKEPFDLKRLLGDGISHGLLSKLHRYPAAVYLFERIELAHPQVIAELSSSFIRGELDGQDLSHAIIIMTTENEWQQHSITQSVINKTESESEELLQLVVGDLPGMNVQSEFEKSYDDHEIQINNPGFSGHFGDQFSQAMTVVNFTHLQLSGLEVLIENELGILRKKLKNEHQIHLTYSPSLARELLTYLPNESYTVMSAKQLMDEKILAMVSNKILNSPAPLSELSLMLEPLGDVVCRGN